MTHKEGWPIIFLTDQTSQLLKGDLCVTGFLCFLRGIHVNTFDKLFILMRLSGIPG